MGSIQIEDLATRAGDEDLNHSFRTFGIPSLKATEQKPSPTSTREELVLLAWLIVLLRTREGSVNYDWAYLDREDGVEQETAMRCLKMEEVMPGVESTVGEAAAAIARYLQAVAPRGVDEKTFSLLLSSTSFEKEEKEVSRSLGRKVQR